MDFDLPIINYPEDYNGLKNGFGLYIESDEKTIIVKCSNGEKLFELEEADCNGYDDFLVELGFKFLYCPSEKQIIKNIKPKPFSFGEQNYFITVNPESGQYYRDVMVRRYSLNEIYYEKESLDKAISILNNL